MKWTGFLVAALAMLPTSVASAQVPTAVAEERVDVNGDGRLDVIRIEEPGSLSIRITGDREASVWKPFTTSGLRLVDGSLSVASGKAYGDRTAIVAVASFGKKRAAPSTYTHEALVVAWKRGRRSGAQGHPQLVEVWRGAVGPRGRDREWSLHVEATPAGLLRYQRKPGVTRCDGSPPYLFPEGYDWKHQRFRPIKNFVRVADSGARLRAVRRPPTGAVAGAAPAVFRARAASAQAGAGDAGELTAPREIDDGDPATAWRDALGGDGRGEFVTITTSMPDSAVRALRILPGDASSDAAFRKANRLKSAALLLGDSTIFWIDFPEDPARAAGSFGDAYWVELPREVEANCATLVIGDVYRARGGTGETAISELGLYTAAELTGEGPFAAWAEEVATGGTRARVSAHALASAGAPAVQAVLAEADKRAGDAAALKRLRALLADIDDPAGAAQIAAGLGDPTLSAGERRTLIASLVRIGAPSIALMRDLLIAPASPAPARNAAIDVLTKIGDPNAAAALIDAVGHGSRGLRRRVAVALGLHSSASIEPIVDAAAGARAAPDPGREADLWRAVGVLAARSSSAADLRARAGAALAARLADATDYELSYRLFTAAGACSSPDALDALRAALGRTGSDARGNALRRVAAAALARNPSSSARKILVSLSGDADPGVRKQVAAAIGQRGDGDATTDRALASMLGSDRWPLVRRATAGALGTRCGRSETAAHALAGTVERDDDLEVRIAALSSLAACAAPGIADLLVKIAGKSAYPTPLRVQAATLIGVLDDPGNCKRAVALFQRSRRETWSSEPALRIASATAGALGALGCTQATDTLVSAASDEAFPELQAAAVTALGHVCPRAPKVRRLFDRLVGSGSRAVALAARSARKACARKQPR